MAIAHYAPIVNVIQIAQYTKVNETYTPWEEQRFRPGDIAAGGVHSSEFFEVTSDSLLLSASLLPYVCSLHVLYVTLNTCLVQIYMALYSP